MIDEDMPDETDYSFDYEPKYELSIEYRELEQYECPRCGAVSSREVPIENASVRVCMICSLRWLP